MPREGRGPARPTGCEKGPTSIFIALWQDTCRFVPMSSCPGGTVSCGLPALGNTQRSAVPRPQGILQAFGIAPFTLMHDKNESGSFVSKGAQFGASHPRTGLCPLSTKLKFCPTQAAFWESSSTHQPSRDGQVCHPGS